MIVVHLGRAARLTAAIALVLSVVLLAPTSAAFGWGSEANELAPRVSSTFAYDGEYYGYDRPTVLVAGLGSSDSAPRRGYDDRVNPVDRRMDGLASVLAARGVGGNWRTVNEAMSARAAAYQARVGGRAGSVYEVSGVKFDALVKGTLVEAKGPGYASFVSGGRFLPWFRGADAMAAQAQRQLAAAAGTPIRWAVAEPQAVTAIQRLFRSRGISGIDVVYIPPG